MFRIALFIVAASAVLPEAQARDADPVRKLVIQVDPMAAAKLSGQPGVTLVTDEKEIAKAFGDDIAKQITGKVDFDKETLVHVAWGSSGPPFGKLVHEIKDGKDDKIITFFIRQPKTLVQGQAYRLGNDFFVVPKSWKVKYGGAR